MINLEQLQQATQAVASKEGDAIEEWLERNSDRINVEDFNQWGAWLLEFFADDVWSAAVLLAGVQMGYDIAKEEFTSGSPRP